MVAYYLDTSALVKRYVQETGSAWVLSITDPATAPRLYTGRLTSVEIVAALYQKVARGELARPDADQAAQDFLADWQSEYEIVEAAEPVISEAIQVARRHAMRAFDAVHLASALVIARARRGRGLVLPTFVSADKNQCLRAVQEGLLVDDPNQHP